MSLSDKIFPPPKFGEPYLLTPGPLTTAYEVKEAMLKDWGSWDDDFRDLTKKLRKNLLSLLGQEKIYMIVFQFKDLELSLLSQCWALLFQRWKAFGASKRCLWSSRCSNYGLFKSRLSST